MRIRNGVLVLAFLLCANGVLAQPLGPVQLNYFGLVIHRSDQGTAWPTVPFGSWRLWDAYVGWVHLEPERGRWDFSRLDKYVAMARLTKVDLLLPLGMPPSWASARPAETSGYRPGNAAEPAQMEDWTRYVETVGRRYQGKISVFEVWNEPSDRLYYTGDVETLVKLTCEANRVLKAIDPKIRVVSPATAGGGKHIDYLDRFLAAGGKECIDIVAHHFYVPRFGPEAMVPLIRQVRQVMQKNSVGHLPLWNTETGWWIANSDGTPDHHMVAKGGWRKLEQNREAGAVLQRAFLLARAEGVERFYWYSWDSKYGFGITEVSDGAPKPMVNDWSRIESAMLGRVVESCSIENSQWLCKLRDENGGLVQITWSDDQALKAREGIALQAISEMSTPKIGPISLPKK